MLIRKARRPVLFYRKVRPGYLYALYVCDILKKLQVYTLEGL
jgi:hypothetical protein